MPVAVYRAGTWQATDSHRRRMEGPERDGGLARRPVAAQDLVGNAELLHRGHRQGCARHTPGPTPEADAEEYDHRTECEPPAEHVRCYDLGFKEVEPRVNGRRQKRIRYDLAAVSVRHEG